MHSNDDPPAPEAPPPERKAARFAGIDPGELLARALNTAEPSVGAQPWTPPTPEELAALLPQYGITALLGCGGMGAVYRGVQSALDRPVAIKLLSAELAADAQFIARFQREARTLARLQHPGIVAVHDFGQTSAGHPYFVMEFVEGTDLQRILRGPGLTPEQALALISQICDALHYAHRQGVIHRDIKPANILVTVDGRAKVADFGLARPLTEDTSTLTSGNVIMGTEAYMAPEQRTGHADARADIYALGVMLYEMLTGQRPHGVFDPPSRKVQIDIRLDEVVLKALQEEPARRYQQAGEMKTDVDYIRSTPRKRERASAKRSRSAVAVIVSGVCLAAFIAAGFLLWKNPRQSAIERPLALGSISGTAPIFFPGTGSYYDLIKVRGTWPASTAAAQQLPTFLGRTGRLATITSPAENDFLRDSFAGNGWIGGYQELGSPEPAGGFRWITTEPFTFANWEANEPSGGDECFIVFYDDGKWNDANHAATDNYYVEYAVPTAKPSR